MHLYTLGGQVLWWPARYLVFPLDSNIIIIDWFDSMTATALRRVLVTIFG